MKKIVLTFIGIIVLGAGALAYLLFGLPRPTDTTDPKIWAADGAALDYCAPLPELDGSGLKADDIPKAFTPGCGFTQFPMPILEGCTEPLPEGAQDLRGLWQAVDGDKMNHIERIEQCGNRVIVSGASIIHDFRTDNTMANGARDINPNGCFNIMAKMRWEEDGLKFRPFNLPVDMVTRSLDGDDLIWKYADGDVTRLKRICKLPKGAGFFKKQ